MLCSRQPDPTCVLHTLVSRLLIDANSSLLLLGPPLTASCAASEAEGAKWAVRRAFPTGPHRSEVSAGATGPHWVLCMQDSLSPP